MEIQQRICYRSHNGLWLKKKKKKKSERQGLGFFLVYILIVFATECFQYFVETLSWIQNCTGWPLFCSRQVCFQLCVCVRRSSILEVTAYESSQQNCLSLWHLCALNWGYGCSVACWHLNWDHECQFEPCIMRLDVRFDLNLPDTPVEDGAAWNCWAMKWGRISCCGAI